MIEIEFEIVSSGVESNLFDLRKKVTEELLFR